ncbi:hypothetical protein LBMAG30_19170 [Comamonadaceae bacterium]|nr:hypothetical protein LBMAG30_19170 [Comamonadaceae bacterium]
MALACVLAYWCIHISVSKRLSRLTITLSESLDRALKEAAVQRDKTIGQLIDESQDFYSIKSNTQALDLVRRARAHSGLDQAQALAEQEVRAERLAE